jgi:hypothetical protein
LKSDGSVVVWGSQTSLPGLSNVIAIAAGWDYTLALLSNQTVIAWGAQTDVPANLSNVVAIAAGNGQNLALRANGTVLAWGDNSFDKTNSPPGLSNVIAVAAGADHCVALKRDGKVVVWGANYAGQLSMPTNLSGVVAISAGALHTIALKADGTLVAWGDNTYGQSTVSAGLAGFFAIAGGGHHSLALKGNGSIVILTQPSTQVVPIGRSASFQVVAVGTLPVSYQWQRNGSTVSGATNSSLLVTNVQFASAATYNVLVANFAGSVLSSNALLTPVGLPPVLLSSPPDQTGFCGDPATFSVIADGSVPLAYQWFFEGAPLPGANQTSLNLGILNTNQTGNYSILITNSFGAVTSALTHLTVDIEAPYINSALTATAKQGANFAYTITGIHSPVSFSSSPLPPGLTLNSTNGLISGAPLVSGTFGADITAANSCASDTRTLVLTIVSSIPIITSQLTATGVEEAPFSYQITATDSPARFAAANLPLGLIVDPLTGLISGKSVYAGEFDATIAASNVWGIGSATLHFTFSNAPVTGLSIANVTYNYSSPYLLDFAFSLRDDNDPAAGHAVVVAPRLLSVVCKENDQPISASETAVIIERGNSKLMKSYLVLDFTESIASLLNGDSNGDDISDAVDSMVAGAQLLVDQQPHDAQIGVYEFHREDVNPQKVIGLTSDKALVNQAIGGIWTNYVQWFPAASRCWDALVAAINDLGATNRDEEHFVVFVSDGKDESSLATIADVITAATNNNVKVYCVGFGAELDAATLQLITSETKGRYYSATNAADLAAGFAEISKDLNGQYLLRWATLKRSSGSFMPSFEVTYQNLTALSPTNPVITTTNITPPATNPPPPVTNIIIAPYIPTQHTGSVTVGALRLVANAEVEPRSVTLRAAYVPRYVRKFRFNYRANWPCTATLQSTNTGEILYGWTLTETNDGAGGKWLQLLSPNQSLTNSIPFGALGNLVRFSLRDMVTASNAFSVLVVDNTVYTNTGGQRFVIENTNAFLVPYPALPFGTPVPWLIAHGFPSNFAAAELSDPDADGVPTWQEYQANTDPQNPNSKLIVRALSRRLDGRWEITFSTALSRSYRAESSFDLLSWQPLLDTIQGTGADATILDDRYLPGTNSLYYRVTVY